MILGKLPLCVIKNPAGSYHFVGKVPVDLAYVWSDPDYLRVAHVCDPAFAMRKARAEGGTFKTRTFPTKEEAIEAAEKIGAKISQIVG